MGLLLMDYMGDIWVLNHLLSVMHNQEGNAWEMYG